MDLMGWTMVFKISKSSDIPPFLAMQVMNQANQMQAAGGDLVHLEVGQPSSPPPTPHAQRGRCGTFGCVLRCLKHVLTMSRTSHRVGVAVHLALLPSYRVVVGLFLAVMARLCLGDSTSRPS